MKYVKLKEISKLGLEKPNFIIGLPGSGLVGSIAATYLTSSKDFEMVGYVESEKLAPVISIHDYMPTPPLRLMASKEKNMLVLLSEASVPVSLSLPLADLILMLIKDSSLNLVISLGGIPKTSKSTKSYVITSNEGTWKRVKDLKVGERIKEGATTGITALLLTKCRIEGIDMITILVESELDVGDPKASTYILKLLSRVTDTPINTSRLEKDAKDYVEEERLTFSGEKSMYG